MSASHLDLHSVSNYPFMAALFHIVIYYMFNYFSLLVFDAKYVHHFLLNQAVHL